MCLFELAGHLRDRTVEPGVFVILLGALRPGVEDLSGENNDRDEDD